ncbi:MAG: 4-alpha-glucanotransferase [Mycolicibacterium insubricum]|nr:4-alpha-glucanotransferase [Mycobacterium sp.]
MTQLDPVLAELAGRLGVATEYDDWVGTRVQVAESTLVAVLSALGVDADTVESRVNSAFELDRRHWQLRLPPTTVAQTGTAAKVWAHVPHGSPARVWVRCEDGTERRDVRQLENYTPPFDLDGTLIGEASFALPTDLPPGYHRLLLRSDADGSPWEADAALIITPAWLGLPERLGAHRLWGLATQLYSVRSKASWGTGDLTDLTDLAVWSAARHGAGFLLVNPLHAAEPVAPMEPSPYLPTSRTFANPLYLRVEAIPEYSRLGKRGIARRLRDDLRRGDRKRGLIDRDAAWAAKREALQQVFHIKLRAGRQVAFAAYRERMGSALDDFAVWCAIAEKFGTDWRRWPAGLRHPRSHKVAKFADKNKRAVTFHRWLQWQLDEQLAGVQSAARQSGMALGLMTDLAVGVHPYGADAWALQDVFASGVNVGAPPDEFNQLGQDWSQPPWRPDRLAEQEYRPLRAVLAAALRHAGGVRIDHIIGLFRLWWIPTGAEPTAGTYVHYDHDAMIGIAMLEASRVDAVIVGEDLGVVQPWVRDYLRARGVLGTSILWFEHDQWQGGAPLRAEYWREYCLSAVTTHDLPPTAGYLAGDHVRLRESLGLLTRSVEEELAADEADRSAWLAELRRVGLLPEAPEPDNEPGEEPGDVDVAGPRARGTTPLAEPGDEEIITALYRYLARTPSRLLALALPDAVGDRRTQNQPGTCDEYPNWRLPLSTPDGRPMLLEDLFRDPRAAALCEVLDAATRAGSPAPGSDPSGGPSAGS